MPRSHPIPATSLQEVTTGSNLVCVSLGPFVSSHVRAHTNTLAQSFLETNGLYSSNCLSLAFLNHLSEASFLDTTIPLMAAVHYQEFEKHVGSFFGLLQTMFQ